MKEKGDFLLLKNQFLSTRANKIHVWTPSSATPQESHAGYQLLNTVIFNVLLRHFCQGILKVENPSCGVPWKPQWGLWPARSSALISRARDGDFSSDRSCSWKLNPDPHSEGLKWENPLFWRVLMGYSADGSCSGINYASRNGENWWIL